MEQEGQFDFAGFSQALPADGDAASCAEKAASRKQVLFALLTRTKDNWKI